MTMLLWELVILAVYAAVVFWMLRRRRRKPVVLDRAASGSMLWSASAGVFVGFGLCYGLLTTINRDLWPAWLPPVAIFIPVMLAQICWEFSVRPPAGR